AAAGAGSFTGLDVSSFGTVGGVKIDADRFASGGSGQGAASARGAPVGKDYFAVMTFTAVPGTSGLDRIKAVCDVVKGEPVTYCGRGECAEVGFAGPGASCATGYGAFTRYSRYEGPQAEILARAACASSAIRHKARNPAAQGYFCVPR
ncbi:MAG: hypothetical protein AB7G39_00410, partial [Alphaproteobacteria bacterium]